MASLSLQQCPLLLQKSSFLGVGLETHNHQKPVSTSINRRSRKIPSLIRPVVAKFDLFSIMGGRGLCNGEKSLQEELKKPLESLTTKTSTTNEEKQDTNNNISEAAAAAESVQVQPSLLLEAPEDAFEKELLGLTGGFPGGEVGLRSFIEKNPPPPPPPTKESSTSSSSSISSSLVSSTKLKPPELPLLMPGMIAIVKNPENPFYMYCGIIQRITDGRAGVLFEGGNWDKLLVFELSELERRDKGPPGVNPKSVELESIVDQQINQS